MPLNSSNPAQAGPAYPLSPVSKGFLPLELSKDALRHKTAVCLSSAEALGGQGHDQVVTAFQLLLGTQERSLRLISASGVTLKLSLVWLLPNPHVPVLKRFLPACPASTVCKDNTSEPGQPVLRPGMQKTWDERLAQLVQGTKPCVFCRASHKSPACSPSNGLCACEQAGVEGLSTLLPQCYMWSRLQMNIQVLVLQFL